MSDAKAPAEVLTYREIAERLDLDHSTVRCIEERALRKMALLLKDRGLSFRDLCSEPEPPRSEATGPRGGT